MADENPFELERDVVKDAKDFIHAADYDYDGTYEKLERAVIALNNFEEETEGEN